MPDIKNNNTCRVCRNVFKSSPDVCSQCKNKVCKVHNLNTIRGEPNPVCDVCFRNHIRQEIRVTRGQEIDDI